MQEVPGRASPKDVRHPPFHRPPASRRWLTALAIALWAATVRAQTDAPLSFESALQLAVARAPELTAAEQAVAAYQERAIAGGQLPDPVLTAGLANLPVGGDNPYSVGADPMTIRRIGVMQKLTDREKRQLRQLRGEQAAARASAEKASTLAAIRRAVASAWLERGYAVKTRQLTESLRAEIALQIATVTPLVASGKAAAADLRAAEMMLVQADDRLEASRQREQIAVQALSRWLGPDAERPPGAFPDTTALTHDVRDVTAALAHHPELSVASETVAIARTDVRLAEREKTPDWTIELAYQHRGERFADMVSLGVSVPLPLFAADRQDRDIRATRAALADAEARQRDVTQRHAAELRAMLEEWQRLGSRIEALETRLLPLARERVELLVAAYGGGSATLGQVLEARRAEVEARLQVLGLARDRALGWARLNHLGIDPRSAPHPENAQ